MPEVIDTNIEQEMQSSYLDYAMSVIVGRALPDARDGLKPVQRRILYAMYMLNNTHNNPTKKSARITGETMGKFHPHGDAAVYEAIVRMAQWFSLNLPLIEGQGNMGCFTKDTKIKLLDGRDIDFEQLIAEQNNGKKHWTFTFNTSTSLIEVTEIKKARLTHKNAELVEVTLDNENKIKCTPDHKFLLHDGTYKMAKDLTPGTSLMPLYTKVYDGVQDKNLKDYEQVLQPNKNIWQFNHHLSDQWNLKEGIYASQSGRIRHHLDFNKKNNNPDNLIRLNWKEHWEVHYILASWRHKNDKEYVKKLTEGRNKYIKENPQIFSKRLSERNKKNWQNPEYRKKHSLLLKSLWKKEEYKKRMTELSSKNLKELWKNKQFQELISDIKSKEMTERWKDESYRSAIQQRTKALSNKLWSDPKHRISISVIMKKIASDPDWIERRKKISVDLWKKPEYRAKFTKDHFSKMSKKSWSNPKTLEMHKKKALEQWKDPEFRALISNYSRERGLILAKNNPEFMKMMTRSAKLSLHKNWQNPAYKQRIIRSKILGFVSSLLTKYRTVTPTLYESERTNNGIPKISHALEYFSNFEQIVQEAKTYNHKVKSVVILEELQDVYDLTADPWHNFALSAGVFVHNSIDGDPPAAQRYTEVRLRKIAEEMLLDLDKETVPFVPNFDNTETEPLVLPSAIPNLLLNGASGIAVGLATNILPHNLNELSDAICAYVDNNELTPQELAKYIKGPDFPTGGIAFYNESLLSSYITGKGSVTIRAKIEEEPNKNRTSLIVKEVPYNVNKAAMVEQIAKLARDKKIIGISDIRDESGKEGIRVVIELKSDAPTEFVLNQLYAHTQLEVTVPVMNNAVIGNRLATLNIKQAIKIFVDYRLEVIKKRTTYDLRIATERIHIVEGLIIAIDNIDEVVNMIKGSADIKDARAKLIERFSMSEKQANAVLDMRLSRLTGLEKGSLETEHKELSANIITYNKILSDDAMVYQIIKDETTNIKQKYAVNRRTAIEAPPQDYGITREDLITDEFVSVILTRNNYVKRINATEYRGQDRGGRGSIAIKLKEGDIPKQMLTCMSKDYLLVLTNKGRAYWLKAYQIPEEGRYGTGKSIANLITLNESEKPERIINTRMFEGSYLTLITNRGTIKKMHAEKFARPRSNGIRAIALMPNDSLADACLSDGKSEIIIITRKGKALRFPETTLRATSRTAHGVRGIRLSTDDNVLNIIPSKSDELIATITSKGYGKITEVGEYRLQGRGGKGVINIRLNDKSGIAVKALNVEKEDDVLLISSSGISIRFSVSEIRQTARNATGVRLMRVSPGENVADAQIIPKTEQLP